MASTAVGESPGGMGCNIHAAGGRAVGAVSPGASWPFVILSEAKDLKARLEILRSLRSLRMTVDW